MSSLFLNRITAVDTVVVVYVTIIVVSAFSYRTSGKVAV